MPGIQTNIIDLGKSFKKWKAQEQAEIRKQSVINELAQKYQRQGHPPYMANRMAETQYLSMHKNQLT